MMLQVLIEATVRSTALFAAVWVLLKVFRLRDLRVEKLIWTAVVLVSLAMPVLMRYVALPLPAPAVPIQIVARVEVLIAEQSNKFGIEQALWIGYLLVTAILLARLVRGLLLAGRLRRSAHRLPISWSRPVDVR